MNTVDELEAVVTTKLELADRIEEESRNAGVFSKRTSEPLSS